MDTEKTGRPNQRRRTRKDLLLAASRLLKQGRKPSLEEIAEEAIVSRATAYRYFPSVEALHREAPLRMMLAHSLERVVRGNEADGELPARQNRRTPLIEAALEPARHQFKPAALKNLSRALALIIGTEAMVVFKDVLQLDDAEARNVKRWAIRALVEAARKSQP